MKEESVGEGKRSIVRRAQRALFCFVEPHKRAHNSIREACVGSTIDKFDQFMEQGNGATSQPKTNTF